MGRIKNIVIRADGNSKVGLGHVYRSIALAQIFEDKSEITFLSNDAELQVIIPSNYRFIHLDVPAESELDFISKHFEPANDVLFVDGYGFDMEYQKGLKTLGFHFVYVDDLIAFEMQADVVLNPSLGISSADYQSKNSRLGLGPTYAPLRPGFLKTSSNKAEWNNPSAEKIFICFGGTDYFNLSSKILKSLNQIEHIKLVVIVGGSSTDENSKYNFVLQKLNGLSSDELIKQIENSDVAITSASTISYEVASVRKPLIVGWYAENQQNLYQGLINQNLAVGLGNILELSDNELFVAVQKSLSSNFDLIIEAQNNIFDGSNQERIKALILPLLTRLTCRTCSENDLELLFEWSNDPSVRSNSMSPDQITMQDHTRWFKSKLDSADSEIFILSEGDQPIGQIRFDLRDNGLFEIDYSIDKSYRGKGYGKELVAVGVDQLKRIGRSENIFGKVVSSNKASLNVFLGLGFVEKEFDQSENLHIFELVSSL